MNIFHKLFKHKHNWYIKERSNVIQYDDMGYPLRLFIIECSKCKQSRQEWIDSGKCSTDVVCKWKKDISLPIPPKAEEKSNESVQIIKPLSSLESEYNAYHTDSDYWKGIKYAIDVLNHKN